MTIAQVKKKVKLTYKPVIPQIKAEVAYTVSRIELNEIGHRIAKKIERNEAEKEASQKLAATFVVH